MKVIRPSSRPSKKKPRSRGFVLRPRLAIPLALIAISSLAGAGVVAVTEFGRASLLTMSKQWLLLLVESWFLLVGWALLFALLRRRVRRLSIPTAIRDAAICHSPLLLCAVLLLILYSSDQANHAYTGTVYGQLIYQPLALGSVVAIPALCQLLSRISVRRNVLVSSLPILAITLVGLLLRVWNANWGLPGLLHPDEHQYIGRGFLMAATGDPNPHYFENPSLMIYIVDLLYLLFGQQAQRFHVITDMLGQGIVDPRGDYLIVMAARAASALAGTATIVGVYLAAKELFGRGVALLSAALLAVSFLHVKDSHYCTNDVMSTALMAGSFYFSTRVFARGHRRDYLLAGLLGGLSVAAKYNAGFFFVPIVVAHIVRLRRVRKPAQPLSYMSPLIEAGVASAAGFLAGTPFALLDLPTFLSDFRSQFGYGTDVWLGQQQSSTPEMFAATLAYGFGLLPLMLAAVGIILAFRRSGWIAAIAVATPLAYLAFMFSQKLYFARFAIPLLPYLAILSGYGIHAIGDTLKQRRARGIFVTGLLFAASLQPLGLSLANDALIGRADTRELAARWIDANLPADATIAIESFAQVDYKFQWTGYAGRTTFPYWTGTEATRKRATSGEFDYLVLSSFSYGPWESPREIPAGIPAVYRDSLEGRSTLLAVIGAGAGNSEVTYSWDDLYTPFWHLLDRERPGPTIKIYRIH